VHAVLVVAVARPGIWRRYTRLDARFYAATRGMRCSINCNNRLLRVLDLELRLRLRHSRDLPERKPPVEAVHILEANKDVGSEPDSLWNPCSSIASTPTMAGLHFLQLGDHFIWIKANRVGQVEQLHNVNSPEMSLNVCDE
jgi:hypothetical protein